MDSWVEGCDRHLLDSLEHERLGCHVGPLVLVEGQLLERVGHRVPQLLKKSWRQEVHRKSVRVLLAEVEPVVFLAGVHVYLGAFPLLGPCAPLFWEPLTKGS